MKTRPSPRAASAAVAIALAATMILGSSVSAEQTLDELRCGGAFGFPVAAALTHRDDDQLRVLSWSSDENFFVQAIDPTESGKPAKQSESPDANPIVPGKTVFIDFPELGNTWKDKPTRAGIYFPTDYSPDKTFPLLVWFGGGAGNDSPGRAIAITQGKGFICVALPYRHDVVPNDGETEVEGKGESGAKREAKSQPGGWQSPWPWYQTMLTKVEATITNIDPDRRIAGGYSSGGAAILHQIGNSEGAFQDYFFGFVPTSAGWPMGGLDSIAGRPMLAVMGEKDKRLPNYQKLETEANAAGVDFQLLTISGAGHKTPPSVFPEIRKWMMEKVVDRDTAAKSADGPAAGLPSNPKDKPKLKPITQPGSQGAAQPTKPPNVILIFADDLGPGMLGCYGQQIVKTPHIDRLATEGMKFNNYYGATYCAPSRFTLLTGMHDGRIGGWQNNRGGLVIKRDLGEITEAEYQQGFAKKKRDVRPIPDHEVLLGQIGQLAGYKTAQFGKLDIGFLTWHERVKRCGWDFYEGYFDHQRCHGYYPPYLWRNGERFDLPGNDDPECGKYLESGDTPAGSGGATHSQNVFIQSILEYIRKQKDEPFFLYHPTQLPHGEIGIPAIHPDYVDDDRLTYEEKKYASMIKMLDDHVGLIMDELKTQGIDDNTIVLFTSDNGHCAYYSNVYDGFKEQVFPDGRPANLTDLKWRTSNGGDVFDGGAGRAGAKRSGFQGGIQCPLIVRWPSRIAAGTESNLLSAHYDFLATLADIGGIESPKGKDGMSYLPTLLGQSQQQTHDYVVVQNHRNYMGSNTVVTRDGWKLIVVGKNRDQYQLYNILKDNEEREELSDQFPEKVKQLAAILEREIDSPRPDLLNVD